MVWALRPYTKQRLVLAFQSLQAVGLACLGLLEAWCSPRSQAQNSSDKDQVDCDNDASSVEDRVQKIFLGYIHVGGNQRHRQLRPVTGRWMNGLQTPIYHP